MGRSWAILGWSWGVLGPSWGDLGRSWAILGSPEAILDRFGGVWGSIWGGIGIDFVRFGVALELCLIFFASVLEVAL